MLVKRDDQAYEEICEAVNERCSIVKGEEQAK
jgi:hypothetical protein